MGVTIVFSYSRGSSISSLGWGDTEETREPQAFLLRVCLPHPGLPSQSPAHFGCMTSVCGMNEGMNKREMKGAKGRACRMEEPPVSLAGTAVSHGALHASKAKLWKPSALTQAQLARSGLQSACLRGHTLVAHSWDRRPRLQYPVPPARSRL